MKKLIVDPDLCIGCGSCIALAPKTFVLDNKSAKAEVINQNGDPQEAIKNSIDGCPTQAIMWKKE